MKTSEKDISALLKLLAHLETSDAPNRQEVLKKRNIRPDYGNMSDSALSECFRLKELAQKGTTFSRFQQRLGDGFAKRYKDDLGVNVDFVWGLLEDQTTYGTWPAPYYARRVGIILRKLKRQDLSERFSLAYCKHVIGS
ncbi:hypothetical protein [Phaeobacter gallaeciensis]|uniref:hypothetical protein n=1 Tax=Phaeobacter gallaeciensis TaxID=60890 RepID=UPI0011BD96F3|nr:hypothetical protein [Phaeobacter gallaeciensis]